MADDRKTIKILYVSQFSHIGGGEMSLLTILRNLDRSRVRPSLIVYEDGPLADRARSAGIETHLFRRAGLFSQIAIIYKMAHYIRKNSIKLVHVNSLDIRAGVSALIAGVPCIGHLRVIFPFTWRDRLFVRLSAVTISVSKAAAGILSAGSTYYQDKMIVLPNMVEIPAGAHPADLRRQFGISGDAVLVGMAGRMDPYKGHKVFIDSASIIKKSVPKAVFLVIGAPLKLDRAEEAYFESIKDHTRSLGMDRDVIFTGFRDDILDVIAALDVVVVPSLVIKKAGSLDTEGFGRVAIEAMALGVPVVSTDAGGLREIVSADVSGVLVPAEDPAALATGVVRILKDPSFAATLISGGKRRFEELYSLRSMNKLYKLYSDTIDKAVCHGR